MTCLANAERANLLNVEGQKFWKYVSIKVENREKYRLKLNLTGIYEW